MIIKNRKSIWATRRKEDLPSTDLNAYTRFVEACDMGVWGEIAKGQFVKPWTLKLELMKLKRILVSQAHYISVYVYNSEFTPGRVKSQNHYLFFAI